jgi:hypothetical protein
MMTRKIALVLFIPVFYMMYYASSSGDTAIGTAGILAFVVLAAAQFILKK